MDPLNPTSTYEVPKGDSKYLKFEKGLTEFMPLASAVVGWLYWTNDKKPLRLAEEPKNPRDLPDIKITEGKADVKHFWAFPVWDFADSKVKVLEITQKTIMSAVRDYATNTKWGTPVMKYSFTVKREGDGFDTEYTIMANPAVDILHDTIVAWEAALAGGFDIRRLFIGGDPFTPDAKN